MKIPAIIGPTAVGKSSIASGLLQKNKNFCFISCDSRKVYRFLDIGTAKPEYSLRTYFSLMDIKFPDEVYNAQQFALDAERMIEEFLKEGKIPVVIGGTPLYHDALFKGLFEFPELDRNLRNEILERLRKEGSKALHEELKKIDPETASKVHPNDWIRITRALEVYYQSGVPMSELKRRRRKVKFKPLYIGILRRRDELYERINRRVDIMIERGLIEETERLLSLGYREDLPSLNTIGYKEIIHFLKGEINLESAVRTIKKRTRIYARRQLYFFKSFEGVRWINWHDEIVEEIFNLIEGSLRS